MIELTEAQMQLLCQHEHTGFARRVHDELVARFPALAPDAGLYTRLCAAHDRALSFGLESGQARTQFLYQEAFAPGCTELPAVAAWLRRPGAPPEQRWKDFMALAGAKLGLAEDRKEA